MPTIFSAAGSPSAALSAGGSLLASQLGARLGLDDAGVIDSRTLGGNVLGVGKFLSPRLYVGFGVSLLGSGQVLTLRYLLRHGVDPDAVTPEANPQILAEAAYGRAIAFAMKISSRSSPTIPTFACSSPQPEQATARRFAQCGRFRIRYSNHPRWFHASRALPW